MGKARRLSSSSSSSKTKTKSKKSKRSKTKTKKSSSSFSTTTTTALLFTKLEPRVRNVSETSIRKKWKKLPTGSQDRLRELFTLLKRSQDQNQSQNRNNIVGVSQQRRGGRDIASAPEDDRMVVEEIVDK